MHGTTIKITDLAALLNNNQFSVCCTSKDMLAGQAVLPKSQLSRCTWRSRPKQQAYCSAVLRTCHSYKPVISGCGSRRRRPESCLLLDKNVKKSLPVNWKTDVMTWPSVLARLRVGRMWYWYRYA